MQVTIESNINAIFISVKGKDPEKVAEAYRKAEEKLFKPTTSKPERPDK